MNGINIKRPNFLFLFPDSHRGDWLPFDKDTFGRMGLPMLPIKMPNIKKLMETGITFTRAVTPSPLCAPARACLAAGLKYENCRVPDNQHDYPPDLPSFYNVLKNSGYRVAGAGKFDLHKNTQFWGLDGWVDLLGKIGFTDSIDNAGKIDAVNSGAEEPGNFNPRDPYMKFLINRGYAESYIKDMKTRKHAVHPSVLPQDLYCDNYLTDNALGLLRNFPANQPWFLQVNFAGPHGPWDVTEEMRSRWKNVDFPLPNHWTDIKDTDINGIRQNYAAMLENIDSMAGKLINEVAARNELDNTVIIYSSDHGEMLGDFGMFGKTRPQRASIHIPLIISLPDTAAKGVLDNSLVELQDLAATFLELAGCGKEPAMQSKSLVPLLNAKAAAHRKIQESSYGDWSVKIIGNHKLVFNKGLLQEIYDLETDVWENENLLFTGE
ncbi:MAG: sulfatase-like hydrolase/transferase [Treponema sp.]|nr:sulfatase-like hydrolase/transferase [Treponema sp.]